MNIKYRVIELENPENAKSPYKIQRFVSSITGWGDEYNVSISNVTNKRYYNEFATIEEAKEVIEYLKEEKQIEPFKVVG